MYMLPNQNDSSARFVDGHHPAAWWGVPGD